MCADGDPAPPSAKRPAPRGGTRRFDVWKRKPPPVLLRYLMCFECRFVSTSLGEFGATVLPLSITWLFPNDLMNPLSRRARPTVFVEISLFPIWSRELMPRASRP